MSGPDQWASYLDPDTPPDVRAEVGSNLDERETAALDRVGRILADEAVWTGPSAVVRDGLLAQVRAESESGGTDPSSEPTREPIDELADRRSRRRRLGMIGGGLAAAAAAVALLLFSVRPDDNADLTTYELAATEFAPDLAATIDVRPLPAGVALTLNIRGLPPADDGTYYAAWVMPESGEAVEEGMSDQQMVGVGSFHWREGGIPIGLWSGVDTDRFPIFVVTLQDEDAPPIASDAVVMTGRLTAG